MLSAQTIKVLIAGALLLHGIAHAIALGALVRQSLAPSRMAVRAWLFPSLPARTAATVAIPFWIIATIGFLAAAMSFWGIFLPGAMWRQLALAASIVSILGIVLFSGMWPGSPNPQRSILNTAIALAMDVAILLTQLWLHWPPQAMFGK